MQRIVQILAFLSLATVLFGCRTAAPQPAEVSYLVTATGFELGTVQGDVSIWTVTDGVIDPDPVTGATVSVNGIDFPYNPARDVYARVSGPVWAAGEELSLQVTVGDASLSGTVTMPGLAAQTLPADGELFAVGDEITVAWDQTENPDHYLITFAWPGGSFHVPVPDGSAR